MPALPSVAGDPAGTVAKPVVLVDATGNMLPGVTRSVAAVTPDDDNDLPGGATNGLYVLVDGNLEIVAADDEVGDAVTIAVTAGMHLPISVRRVMTGTTATVLAFY